MLQSWDQRGKTAWREASWSATRISRQNSQALWQCKLFLAKTNMFKNAVFRICNNGKLEKMKTPFGFKSPRGLLPQCEYKVTIPSIKMLKQFPTIPPLITTFFRARSTARGMMSLTTVNGFLSTNASVAQSSTGTSSQGWRWSQIR